MAHFHHFSMCNQNEWISNLVICGQNTKAIALLFGQKWLTFITFQCAIKMNEFQIWSFLGNYQGYSLTFWPKMGHYHHLSMCNQNEWISNLVICGQNTKAIALLFGQKWLTFITFQCAIKMNEFQIWSFLGNYQGYSLTFWPKMGHYHHLSMCNQNEWISNLVIFGQNTKAIALLFGQKWLTFITFQCAIKMNEFQMWSYLGKKPRL